MVWCLLRRLFLYSLRPPTQPTNRQANTRNTAGGWLVPERSLLCGVCFAGFFILAAPTHPTARKPPRGGVAAARAPPRGRPNMAGYVPQPAILWPAPWGARSAGGRPYPAPVVPPRPILCGLLLRFLLAAPAPRLRFACVADSRCSHPRPSCRPMGGKGAPPKPPPPPIARFGSLCSPSRPLSPCPMGAQARPLAFVGCFGGLLHSRPSWFLLLSLASALRAAVRSFRRLWFSGWGFESIIFPIVRGLGRFTRPVRSWAGFCVGFCAPYCRGRLRGRG